MKRNSQKGIAYLLLIHSLGLLLTLVYVGKELITLFPQFANQDITQLLIHFFLDRGLGWLLLGMAFLQYLRKVKRDWEVEGFKGRILFQLYSAYYLLELFRMYGARANLGYMGLFFYLFMFLFALQGFFSVVLYMVRSLEKPWEKDDDKNENSKKTKV